MRNILLGFVFILITATSTSAQEAEWLVQIAVYNQQVPSSNFANITERIFYSKDAYDFHRYYIGKYSDAEIDAQKERIAALGYNATSVHIGDFDARCTCYKTPMPREITTTLKSIFFDFDKYGLRSESKKQLNLLAKNLKENSSFSTVLRAHTDSKGSNSYNERLSQKRVNAAKNYLMANGIDESRIKTATFGEEAPIAKNELDNGRDTAEGRQYNRRVEVQILNGEGEQMYMVLEIEVPTSLAVN